MPTISAVLQGVLAVIDWGQAGILFGVSVIAAFALKFVPWVTRSGIEDVVKKELHPFYDRLHRHLQDEEAELRNIHKQLAKLQDRKNTEHDQIWAAIDELR